MKNVLKLFLTIMMIICVSACAKQENNSFGVVEKYTNETEEIPNTADEDTSEPIIQNENEITIAKTESYELEDVIQGFSEGLAWVKCRGNDGKVKIAVINKNSDIIYLVDDEKYGNNPKLKILPFKNGQSCFFEISSSVGNDSKKGFTIIDSNGNEVFKNDEYFMCGRGDDGKYLLAKHQSGFSEDQWYAFTMNSDFSINNNDIAVSEDVISQSKEFLSLAEGVYKSGYGIINYNNNSYIDITYHRIIFGEKYTYVNTYVGDVILPTDIVCSFSTIHDYENAYNNSNVVYHIPYNERQNYSTYQGGTIFEELNNSLDYRYLDVLGNEIVSFPKFPEGVKYKKIDGFSGGYCALYLIGVDGKLYVTIIDELGNQMYEPICITKYGKNSMNENLTSFAGYVITDEQIINPQGKNVSIGDDLTSMDIGESFYYEYSAKVIVSEGYIYYKNILCSLDGKDIIKHLTLAYDNDEQIIQASNKPEGGYSAIFDVSGGCITINSPTTPESGLSAVIGDVVLGSFKIGDTVELLLDDGRKIMAKIHDIEMWGEHLTECHEGDSLGITFDSKIDGITLEVHK